MRTKNSVLPIEQRFWKLRKSVQFLPESVFKQNQNRCSSVTRMSVQVFPEYAPGRPSVYDLEIQKKIDAIELAEKLDNVSEAARLSGCSRETIYKNRKLLREQGPQALKRHFRSDHYHKNRAPKSAEALVLAFSLDNPHLGQAQVSAQLRESHGLAISPSGVRNIWMREKMNTAAQRLERSRSPVRA